MARLSRGLQGNNGAEAACVGEPPPRVEPRGRYTCRKKQAVGGGGGEGMAREAERESTGVVLKRAETKRVQRFGGGEEEFP